MPTKLDYKKEYKDLYLPGAKPVLIDVPAIPFIMIDGVGAPEGTQYQNAVGVLYALSYTIKMSKIGGNMPNNYFEYVVPPLEGLWLDIPGTPGSTRSQWRWTSLIRLPAFVDPPFFNLALEQATAKKPELDFSTVRFETWQEGLCVQALHTGPFSEEPATLAKMTAFMQQENLLDDTGFERRHHEIYLSDPRKTPPEKCKTVLRHPVKKRK